MGLFANYSFNSHGFIVSVTPCHLYHGKTPLAPHEHTVVTSLSRSPSIILTGPNAPGFVKQISFFGLPTSGSSLIYEGLLLNTQNHGGANLSDIESFPICFLKTYTFLPNPFYQGAGSVEIYGLDLNRPETHHIGAEISSFGSIKSNISSIYTSHSHQFGFFASGVLDEGIPQYSRKRMRGELNQHQVGSFGLKSMSHLTDTWSLSILAQHKKSRLHTDGMVINSIPRDRIFQKIDLGILKLIYKPSGPFNHQITVGGYAEKNEYLFTKPIANRFQSIQSGYQLTHQTKTSKTSAFLHMTFNAYAQTQKMHQNHARLFLSHQVSLMATTQLTVGSLIENMSHQSITLSPQIMLKHDLETDLTATISYKQTQRFPTLLEKHGIENIQQANANLRPEKGQTFITTLSWSPDLWDYHLSFFHTYLEDAISARTTGPNLYQKFNQSLRTYGTILNIHWSKKKISIGATYTLTLSRSKNKPSLQNDVIKHKGHVYLEHGITKTLTVKSSLNIYGSRRSHRFTKGAVIPTYLNPYVLLKSKITYMPIDKVTLYIEGKNLLNQGYTLVPDYRAPGRSIHVGIHGRF
jgi:outer membrane cobalamin receptor